MNIFFNEKNALHDVVGRFIRRPGQSLMEYDETALYRPEPHPADDVETPKRLAIIRTALEAAGFSWKLPQDWGMEPILAVHTPDYLEFLKTVYAENAALLGYPAPVWPETFPVRFSRKPTGFLGRKGYYAMDIYTPIVAGTWEAAYWSAQTALTAAHSVMNGERMAYAVCRPSGHHAAADLYGGYCFLNNAAAAARLIQHQTNTRVALLDFDYHHGNGTQAIFYDDPSVLFVSLHGDPQHAFPYYSGWADEKGEGAGEGFNLNIPLPNGTDDAAYLMAFEQALEAIRTYKPDYLVVSCGFDICAGDPYGGFRVTPDGVQEIGKRIAQLGLPAVLIQEGGYVPPRLGEYVVTFLQGVEG